MTSTSEENQSNIIKSDRIGRQHYTPEFKAQLLAAFEQSSMSGQSFAKHHGVKYPTFASWRAKARRESHPESDRPAENAFILAEVSAPNAGLAVEFPGGVKAYAHDASSVALLATLIKALA